jgi:uncharacterized protein
MNAATRKNPSALAPWWRVGMVWLVIAGPLIVVIAGFATLAIAILNPDPVYTLDTPRSAAEMPAVQGRNHAATPPIADR